MQTFKILVTGELGAGKSQFVQSISELDILIADSGLSGNKPVAFDFGRITIDDDLVLYFFVTPFARRIDDLMENIPGLIGVIFVVDSQDSRLFGNAIARFRLVDRIREVPCVVAANKQDDPDAWSANDIRLIFRIEDDIPVVPCVATDRESVKNVLLELMDVILRDLE